MRALTAVPSKVLPTAQESFENARPAASCPLAHPTEFYSLNAGANRGRQKTPSRAFPSYRETLRKRPAEQLVRPVDEYDVFVVNLCNLLRADEARLLLGC
jgi:hypothetical protein